MLLHSSLARILHEVHDETDEMPRETSGEHARRQVRRHRACEVERSLRARRVRAKGTCNVHRAFDFPLAW
jgi:hypothetical protein